MIFIAHYTVVPLPDIAADGIEARLSALELPATRVTRSLSVRVLKSTGGPVARYLVGARVDSVNDSYRFPGVGWVQGALDGLGVVVDEAEFTPLPDAPPS